MPGIDAVTPISAFFQFPGPVVRPSRSRPKCNLLLPCANRSHRIIALPSVPAPGCSDSTSISSLSPFARRASPLPAVSIMNGFCGPCKGSCITHPFCPGHRPIAFLHCVPLMILRTPSLSSFAFMSCCLIVLFFCMERRGIGSIKTNGPCTAVRPVSCRGVHLMTTRHPS